MSGLFPAPLLNQLLDMVRRADHDRYLCTLYMPADVRGQVAALYAFNAELAQIRERISDPAAGEIRLNWWLDVVDAIYLGKTMEAPVAQGLARAIETGDLPRHTLKAMLEARVFDLYDDPMPHLEMLEGYLGETSSALMHLVALVLARYDALSCADASGLCGVAVGLTGLLRSIAIHRARGQCFLPADLLARHDLTPAHVLAGREGTAMELVLAQLRGHASNRLQEARDAVREIPPAAFGAYLPCSLVPNYLTSLDRAGVNVLKTVPDVSRWRKQFSIFRAARLEFF